MQEGDLCGYNTTMPLRGDVSQMCVCVFDDFSESLAIGLMFKKNVPSEKKNITALGCTNSDMSLLIK
jgi:hypothetical protein